MRARDAADRKREVADARRDQFIRWHQDDRQAATREAERGDALSR
jgi:hypothetical protein